MASTSTTEQTQASVLAARQWLAALEGTPAPHKGPVAVVSFRNRRWIEWSLYTACQLYRLGYEPVLLHSRAEIARAQARRANVWQQVREKAPFRYFDIDDFMPPEAADAAEFTVMAKRAAPLVVAHDRRREVAELELDQGAAGLIAQSERQLLRYAVACRGALAHLAPPRAICPSGLIGWSPAFLDVALRLKIPTTFVEFWIVRPGHMIWNLNRPAVDHDLQGWLSAMGQWDLTKEREIDELVRWRETGTGLPSGWLADFHSAQRSPRERSLPPDLQTFLRRPGRHFLLGTNVVGDSAMLGRSTAFRSQREWLQATCDFFRRHPGLNLTVRAHPDEAVLNYCRVRMGDLAAGAAGGANNIFVVHGSDDVNTYALGARVDLGLTWTSTLGVDMVVRGKPVLVAAAAPYLEMGVGLTASTGQEYFDRLLALDDRPVPPSAEMVRAAKIYQWIVFRARSLCATTRVPDSSQYRVQAPGSRGEEETFYRILAGELDDKGRALWP